MIIPVIAGHLLGSPDQGILAGLSALQVGLADPTGDYRVRAFVLLATVIGVVSMFTLSPIFGETIWLAVPSMALVTFAGAMLGVFGSSLAKVGLVTSLSMLIGLTVVSTDITLVDRLLVTSAGGFLAMAFALWAWPFRPFEPLLQSVADGFRKFATLMESLAEFTTDERNPQLGWQDQLQDERNALTTSINETRSAIIGERVLRTGRNATIDATLLISHLQYRMAVASVALAEAVQQLKSRPLKAESMSLLAGWMRQLEGQTNHIATAIESQFASPRQADSGEVQAPDADLNQAIPDTTSDEFGTSGDTDFEAALGELRAIAENLDAAIGILRDARRPLIDRDPLVPATLREMLRQAGARFASNLTFDSLMFRYALRLAVTVAVAVAVTYLLDISQGFWVSLTVIVVLKPDFGGSRKSAIDRTMATLLGGGLAAVLVAFVLNIFVLYALVIVAGVFAFSELAYNYRWGVAFLTIFIIALLNLADPGNWTLAVERVAYTAIGGALAIVAGYVLWPLWMRAIVPEKIALAMAANRDYFDHVVAAYGGASDPAAIRQSRSKATLSNSNEEVAFQRLLTESGRKADNIGPYYELGVANRQFTDRVTALALHHDTARNGGSESSFEPLITAIDASLETLEKVVNDESAGTTLPDLNQALRQATGNQHPGLAGSPSSSSASHAGTGVVTVELARLVSDLQLMIRASHDLAPGNE